MASSSPNVGILVNVDLEHHMSNSSSNSVDSAKSGSTSSRPTRAFDENEDLIQVVDSDCPRTYQNQTAEG